MLFCLFVFFKYNVCFDYTIPQSVRTKSDLHKRQARESRNVSQNHFSPLRLEKTEVNSSLSCPLTVPMPLKTRHFLYVFVCVGDGGEGSGGSLGVEGRVYICEFSAVFLF